MIEIKERESWLLELVYNYFRISYSIKEQYSTIILCPNKEEKRVISLSWCKLRVIRYEVDTPIFSQIIECEKEHLSIYLSKL